MTGSLGHFWSQYLPRNEPQTTSFGRLSAAPWATALQQLSTSNNSVGLALSACALNVMARTKMDHQLLYQGDRLYSKALREVNIALSQPARTQDDALLGACKIMAMFEQLRVDDGSQNSQRGHNWMRHV